MSHELRSPKRATQPANARIIILPRPVWLDFFLILVGCALSLLLTERAAFRAVPSPDESLSWIKESHSLLTWLPHLLFLPLGILLFWPAFYLTQRFGGRSVNLAIGEWLWGLTWLGAVVLTAWILWQPDASVLPESLPPDKLKRGIFVGYALAVLALGAVALLTGLVDLFMRWKRPWTHECAVALLTWPALLVLFLLVCKIKME
jgi:hypothetical protein